MCVLTTVIDIEKTYLRSTLASCRVSELTRSIPQSNEQGVEQHSAPESLIRHSILLFPLTLGPRGYPLIQACIPPLPLPPLLPIMACKPRLLIILEAFIGRNVVEFKVVARHVGII